MGSLAPLGNLPLLTQAFPVQRAGFRLSPVSVTALFPTIRPSPATPAATVPGTTVPGTAASGSPVRVTRAEADTSLIAGRSAANWQALLVFLVIAVTGLGAWVTARRIRRPAGGRRAQR